MLNKPTGIITSVKDEKNRKTVIDLINVKERIYPIGRLDYDSSGLLLLTMMVTYIITSYIQEKISIKLILQKL